MKKQAVAVSAVAALLGTLSAALAFAVEANRVEAVDSFTCIYPSSPGAILALAAAVLLLAAQFIVNGFAGCHCCLSGRGNSAAKAIASISFIFSWMSYIVAMLLLLRIAVLSKFGILADAGRSPTYCSFVVPGIAAGGGAMALISVLLGIVHYHATERLKEERFRKEVQLAPHQFPVQPPEVLHEDTNNPRQALMP